MGNIGRVAVGVLVVGAVALGSLWVWNRHVDGDRPTDARTVALPAPPQEPDQVRSYFAGPAAPLLALVRRNGLTAGDRPASASVCSGLRPSLDAFGEPGSLRQIAEDVPDPALVEMTMSYIDELVIFLDACDAGLSPASHDLRFAHTVLERQLGEVGVR